MDNVSVVFYFFCSRRHMMRASFRIEAESSTLLQHTFSSLLIFDLKKNIVFYILYFFVAVTGATCLEAKSRALLHLVSK